ncbi:MAG: hypothetical protein H6611_09730 [Ignavibacteriales bacterium]|nr:hypothetical protein [Ignavibacteriales bacterium]
MKTTNKSIQKQSRASKLRKAYRRTKQLLKYRINQLETITDHDTIVFYLRQIDSLNHQRILIEKQLGAL